MRIEDSIISIYFIGTQREIDSWLQQKNNCSAYLNYMYWGEYTVSICSKFLPDPIDDYFFVPLIADAGARLVGGVLEIARNYRDERKTHPEKSLFSLLNASYSPFEKHPGLIGIVREFRNKRKTI